MPHIVLDLPDQKPGLDAAIMRQFTDIQRQLMGLVKSQQEATATMRADLLSTMRQQQEDLTDALESLVKSIQQKPLPMDHSDKLVEVIRDLRQTMSQMHQTTPIESMSKTLPQVTVRPQVTVSMPPALLSRLDSLESSLLQGMRRSRSRTFGSNY